MKETINITKEIEETVEVNLPLFLKRSDEYYLINSFTKDTLNMTIKIENHWCSITGYVTNYEALLAYRNGTEITYDEFKFALDAAKNFFYARLIGSQLSNEPEADIPHTGETQAEYCERVNDGLPNAALNEKL